MKPIDVKWSIYIDLSVKNSNKKVGDHVKISKCMNLFAKGHIPNWSKEVVVMKIWNVYRKRVEKAKSNRVLVIKVLNYMSNGKVFIICLIAG